MFSQSDRCRILGVTLVLSVAGCSSGRTSPDTVLPPGDENAVTLAGVVPPPADLLARLKLDTSFYAQYLDAGGIPVLASRAVSPYALREAGWIIERMLERREELVAAIRDSPVRTAIMAVDEFTTDLPEHADLTPADWWDRRARGLGGTMEQPAVSAGEENLLALAGDPYAGESILVHEFAHAVLAVGMAAFDPTFDARLEFAFERALAEGLWLDTYAATNRHEYFAEGAQSWFDTNGENNISHGPIDTREELASYDPRLAALLTEVFGDSPWRYRSPAERDGGDGSMHLAGFERDGAPAFSWPDRLVGAYKRDEPVPGRPLENRIGEDWSARRSVGGGRASRSGSSTPPRDR